MATTAAVGEPLAQMPHSDAEATATAMVEALKRKVMDLDTQLLASTDALNSTERTLEVEKREHQLTTSKLSTLLKKRSLQAANLGDEPPADIGDLRHQIGCLREKLAHSQASETSLRANYDNLARQHEQLRVLTLEGFRSKPSNFADDSVRAPAGADSRRPNLTVSTESHVSSSLHCLDSPSVREALRLAQQPVPLRHSLSSESLNVTAPWRGAAANHAIPRVGLSMARSISMPHPQDSCSAVAAPCRHGAIGPLGEVTATPAQQIALSELPSASIVRNGNGGAGGASGPAPSVPHSVDMSARQQMLARAPQGYARGAISIEPPKRQQKVTSITVQSARSPAAAQRAVA